jgi:hypothetical protein
MNIKCLYGFHDVEYISEQKFSTHINKIYKCKRCGHKYVKTDNLDGVDEITNMFMWLATLAIWMVCSGILIMVI